MLEISSTVSTLLMLYVEEQPDEGEGEKNVLLLRTSGCTDWDSVWTSQIVYEKKF
jgi:hypothetical protein